jgi:hypothetical protein
MIALHGAVVEVVIAFIDKSLVGVSDFGLVELSLHENRKIIQNNIEPILIEYIFFSFRFVNAP